jgi:hypothetical protein
MFHGMWDSGNLDSVDPQTGEKRRNLMRNGRIVPPIVQIHNDLYVSERVKKKLEGVPGIRFVRANFTRLVDYPFAKGDFFFYKTPYFQAAGCPLPSQEFFDGFLRSLPDVPEYHRTIETFYKWRRRLTSSPRNWTRRLRKSLVACRNAPPHPCACASHRGW